MTYKRKSECTPEEWERHLANRQRVNRKWRASPKGKEAARAARQSRDEAAQEKERQRKRESAKRNREAHNKQKRKWEAANTDKVRRYRRQANMKRLSPKASKRQALELMKELNLKAPKHHGREEIIATATMFVLEGDTIEVALAKASKAHNADVRIQKSSTNFEEAYWL